MHSSFFQTFNHEETPGVVSLDDFIDLPLRRGEELTEEYKKRAPLLWWFTPPSRNSTPSSNRHHHRPRYFPLPTHNNNNNNSNSSTVHHRSICCSSHSSSTSRSRSSSNSNISIRRSFSAVDSNGLNNKMEEVAVSLGEVGDEAEEEEEEEEEKRKGKGRTKWWEDVFPSMCEETPLLACSSENEPDLNLLLDSNNNNNSSSSSSSSTNMTTRTRRSASDGGMMMMNSLDNVSHYCDPVDHHSIHRRSSINSNNNTATKSRSGGNEGEKNSDRKKEKDTAVRCPSPTITTTSPLIDDAGHTCMTAVLDVGSEESCWMTRDNHKYHENTSANSYLRDSFPDSHNDNNNNGSCGDVGGGSAGVQANFRECSILHFNVWSNLLSEVETERKRREEDYFKRIRRGGNGGKKNCDFSPYMSPTVVVPSPFSFPAKMRSEGETTPGMERTMMGKLFSTQNPNGEREGGKGGGGEKTMAKVEKTCSPNTSSLPLQEHMNDNNMWSSSPVRLNSSPTQSLRCQRLKMNPLLGFTPSSSPPLLPPPPTTTIPTTPTPALSADRIVSDASDGAADADLVVTAGGVVTMQNTITEGLSFSSSLSSCSTTSYMVEEGRYQQGVGFHPIHVEREMMERSKNEENREDTEECRRSPYPIGGAGRNATHGIDNGDLPYGDGDKEGCHWLHSSRLESEKYRYQDDLTVPYPISFHKGYSCPSTRTTTPTTTPTALPMDTSVLSPDAYF